MRLQIFNTKSCLAVLLAFFLAICGCGGSGGTDETSGYGSVAIGLTDAAGDFVRYAVDVRALKLYKTDGTVVDTIPSGDTTTVDFTQLTNMTEFITVATVEAGSYDQVVMTLDYTDADIQVLGTDGATIIAVPLDSITDENGTPITSTIDITIDLDSNLQVVGNRSVHMALDFNLEANNVVTITTAGDGSETASLEVSPTFTADLIPDTTKIQRFRGTLLSVDTENNLFVMTVCPFFHDLAEDDFYGTMTVQTVDSTVYNIDGTNYSGADGLAALSSEAEGAAVVAHGVFDADLNFTATEVLAGISVRGVLDSAKGSVISRDENTLTLMGATLGRERSHAGHFFKHTLTVVMDTTTKVSKQFSAENFAISDISVGQQVEVFGTYSSDADEMDATNGYVRMNLTTISGNLNYPPAGDDYTANPEWHSISLDRIETVSVGRKGHNTARFHHRDETTNISLFDFSGTGIDTDHDASATDYTIQLAQGLDGSSLSTNNMPIKMKGFMKPFGTAPEDFDAQTIIDLSDTRGFLNVDWGSDGQLESDAFTEIPTESAPLVLNGDTMSSVGHFHSVSRGGNVTDFVKEYPGTDITVQADGDSDDVFSLIMEDGNTRVVYNEWADFIADLNIECADGALIKRLHGRGTFNDSTLTFSAHSLSIALTNTATEE